MGLFDTMFEKIEQNRKEKEVQREMDRETIRNSAHTEIIRNAIRKEFLSGGSCYKILCDQNVSSFHIKVLREGIIAKVYYWKEVNKSFSQNYILLRFSDVALGDLKNSTMTEELQSILLKEIGTMDRIKVDKDEISLIKREW